MDDSKLQSLPVGSYIERSSGEVLVIVDKWGDKYAKCIRAGSASNWFEGRIVHLPNLESSKYHLYKDNSFMSGGSGGGHPFPTDGYSFLMSNLTISCPPNPTPVNSLTAIAKRLLDSKTKTLIKSGFMTNDLRLTPRGLEALDAIVADEHKDALVEAAQAVLDEEKDN